MASAKVHPKILPVTRENYPAEIPEFATEAEERDFWDTHDGDFYFSLGVEVTDDASDVRPTLDPVALHAPSRWTGEVFGHAVTIWLTSDEMARVERRATALTVDTEELLGRWIVEALEGDGQEAGTTSLRATG